MAIDLAKLVVRLEAETAQYMAKMDQANAKLAKFSSDSEKRFQELENTLVGFFAVDKLTEWSKHILEGAEDIGHLAQRAGLAVEDLGKLQYAFGTSSVSGEALQGVLKNLNKNLSEAAGNAKSDAAIAFKAMGIAVEDSTGKIRKADDVIFDIADHFKSYADGANKGALANATLGKSGEEAIPALNKGGDALRRLGDEGQRLGKIISEELSEQADEFNSRLARMKTLLVDGLGNQIASKLLPSLNELGKAFEETADGGERLAAFGDGIATILKFVTDGALSAAHFFDQLGQQFGALAAAGVAAAEGDFRRVVEIFKARNDDAIKQDEAFHKRITALWRNGGDDLLQEVKVTAKKIQAEAPNIAGTAEIQKAVEASIKTLTDFKNQLMEQVATFGLGEAAAIKYRLEFGNLADEVKKAGAAGDALKTGILAAANFKQAQVDVKALGDAFAEVNAQVKELTGDSVGAAAARFEKQNAELRKTIDRNGTQGDTDRLNALKDLVVAQAEYNKLQVDAERITSDLAEQEQRITNSQQVGATSELDALQQLDSARTDAVHRLEEIHDKQQAIAEASGNPALVEGAKKFAAEIENIAAQTNLLQQKFKSTFEDAASGPFADFISGAESASDAVKDFAAAFEREIAQLIAKDLIGRLFNGLGIGDSASKGGGILGSIGSLISGALGGGAGSTAGAVAGVAANFSGPRANGGPVSPNGSYLVGERGPEMFVPNTAGKIIPNGEGGGHTTIQQTFILDQPASRQTQQQVAAAASRGLQQGNRRNN